MIQRLSGKLSQIQRSSKDALSSLENLEENMAEGVKEEHDLASLLESHREHLQNLLDSTAYFQLRRHRNQGAPPTGA
jgi:chromosome segregation ATPase